MYLGMTIPLSQRADLGSAKNCPKSTRGISGTSIDKFAVLLQASIRPRVSAGEHQATYAYRRETLSGNLAKPRHACQHPKIGHGVNGVGRQCGTRSLWNSGRSQAGIFFVGFRWRR